MILASHQYPNVAAWLEPFIGGGTIADALAYLGIVLASLGLATLLTLAIRKLMHVLLVGWLDRFSGALFGAGQGIALATLVLFLIVRFEFMGLEKAVGDSELSLAVLGLLPGAVELLPPELGSIGKLLQLPRR
jgi:membrane protein required for colicin V production